MIKLFHVISDSNIGGAGRYLLTYLRNCDKKTFDVFVAVPKGSKLKQEILKLGFKLYEIDDMAEKSVSYGAQKQLYRIFKEVKPDIVHAHASLSARISAKRAGVKTIVYTRHSVFPQKKSLTQGIGKIINGRVGKILSTGIIAVANAAKQNLTDTGINPKLIRVIYNGVDKAPVAEEKEVFDFKKKYNIEDEPVIAIIARLEQVKGHKYFIDAAKFLKDKNIKAKFIIAGNGTEEENLKKYVFAIFADYTPMDQAKGISMKIYMGLQLVSVRKYDKVVCLTKRMKKYVGSKATDEHVSVFITNASS